MKAPWFCIALLFCILIVACKKEVPDNCQGQGVSEWLSYVDGRGSVSHTIKCSGRCPDKTACDTIVKKRGFFMDKLTWCGCKGDTKPRACDVMLDQKDTFDIFLCTPLLEGCPGKGDSCLLVKRILLDTIRTVVTKMDSVYRRREIFTCECMNRKPI